VREKAYLLNDVPNALRSLHHVHIKTLLIAQMNDPELYWNQAIYHPHDGRFPTP